MFSLNTGNTIKGTLTNDAIRIQNCNGVTISGNYAQDQIYIDNVSQNIGVFANLTPLYVNNTGGSNNIQPWDGAGTVHDPSETNIDI